MMNSPNRCNAAITPKQPPMALMDGLSGPVLTLAVVLAIFADEVGWLCRG
jgi:hypothetical protein